MSGVITTGNNPRLLLEGLKNVFGAEYKAHAKQYDKIFDETSSKKAYEVDQMVETFGLAPVKDEGDDLAYDSQSQSFNPKYVHLTRAKGFIVTKENQADELYGMAAKRAKALGFSFYQTKEVVGANVLNNGFDSSFTMPGGDGVELFSTSHSNGPSGGTFANKLTTDADLTETSLEDMLILIGNATDTRGLQIAIQAQRLIVPVALQFTAQRILGSVLQNDTANNATNAIRDMGAIDGGYVKNNFLTDTDAWFIKTNCPQGMTCMNRQALDFGQDNAFNSGNLRFKADERYSMGWSDPRGIYGTSGA